MSTTTCPACGKPVLVALDRDGSAVLLNPPVYEPGKFAVYTEFGVLRVRPVLPGSPVPEGAERHSAHRCEGRGGGLAAVRQAQAKNAAAARNRRGTYTPSDRSPFRGAVPGGRITPPGAP